MRKGYAIFSCKVYGVKAGLLFAKREDDGEGLEGSHELLLQFGDLSFGEG